MRKKRRGQTQRDVIRCLAQGGGEMSVGELGRQVPRAHRSNLRRAVRLLVDRGDVVEVGGPGGERRIRLGPRLALLPVIEKALAGLDPEPEEEPRLPSMEEMRAELRRRREEYENAVPVFYGYRPEDGVRERALLRPGPVQRKVLSVLWHVPDPTDGGLPAAAVVEIVGGDAGGVRRAVRSLLRAGRVQRSECGRIRLSREEASGFRFRSLAGLVDDPPNAERVREVLARGSAKRGRARGTPVV